MKKAPAPFSVLSLAFGLRPSGPRAEEGPAPALLANDISAKLTAIAVTK